MVQLYFDVVNYCIVQEILEVLYSEKCLSQIQPTHAPILIIASDV